MKTVKQTPPLDEAQRRRLSALADVTDDQIDTSDMPELSDQQLADMVRGQMYRPIKKQITARLDADVLEWLKSPGKGYQSRMNAILRKAMLNAQ